MPNLQKYFLFLVGFLCVVFPFGGCQQKTKPQVFVPPTGFSMATLSVASQKNISSESVFTTQQKPSQQTSRFPASNSNMPNLSVYDLSDPSDIIITHGKRDQKVIALTFDADMTPKMLHDLQSGKIKNLYDQRITDTLKKDNVAATIFITGLWAQTYPDAVRDFAKDPLFEIANHSWDHKAFSLPCYGLPPTENKENELNDAQKILSELTGKTPQFFRFPGGCSTDEDVKFVHEKGLKVVGWDVISGDAFLKDPKKIETEVLQKSTNGSIVVMHLDGGPNSPATAKALPRIIDGLKKKGFRFVTVSELLDDTN